jgi:hypothetical protein
MATSVGLFGAVIGSTNPKDGELFNALRNYSVWDCSSVITKSYPNLGLLLTYILVHTVHAESRHSL